MRFKLQGCLGLLNFVKHYQAGQLDCLAQYYTVNETPLWVNLEAIDCDNFAINNLLWLHPRECKLISYPITLHYLAIQIQKWSDI